MKRLGYRCFCGVLHAISDLDIPLDSGDFLLMDRRVADLLVICSERSSDSCAGFRQFGLPHERAARKGASRTIRYGPSCFGGGWLIGFRVTL